jgi:hypothetical protein
MTLIADWPETGIREHTACLDGSAILDAVKRVVRIWEDDRPSHPDAPSNARSS